MVDAQPAPGRILVGTLQFTEPAPVGVSGHYLARQADDLPAFAGVQVEDVEAPALALLVGAREVEESIGLALRLGGEAGVVHVDIVPDEFALASLDVDEVEPGPLLILRKVAREEACSQLPAVR